MNRSRFALSTALLLAGLTVFPTPVVADIMVIGENGNNNFTVNDDFIFRSIFRTVSSENEVRIRLATALEVHLEALQQSFQISDAQNRKLKLAGEIEIHHFLDDLESIKPRKNQITQEEWQALHQKMQPLKVRYNNGLHGMGSLFRKTIASTLTPEQQASWQQEQQARLQRQYHAAVAATISMIDGQLPLTKKQREMFQTVILTKTVPPSNVPADYLQVYLVLYAISTVPEEELRPIFTAEEWKGISQLRTQGKAMFSMLKQQGIFDEDGDDDAAVRKIRNPPIGGFF